MLLFQARGALAFQKDSPYLQIFNHQLSLLKMAGIVDRLMQNVGSPIITNCNKTPYNDIKIENILVAFIILACGTIAAMGILIIEVTLNCFSMGKKSTNSLKARKNPKTKRLNLTLKSGEIRK